MQAEVITKIQELVQQAEGKLLKIDGQEYTTIPLHDPRKKLPTPEVITVHTLKGLTDYLARCPDDIHPEDHLIHVVGPNEVQLVSKLHGHFQQRFLFVRAVTPNAAAESSLFGFAEFIPAEEMVIALQSLFVDTGDRAQVLALAGVVNDEVVKTQKDDGVTQVASVKADLTFKTEMEIPNPVTLAPFRTFREIEQPSSKFVFRGKPGGSAGTLFALFEAEGSSWELEAVKRIHTWLEEKHTGFNIIS